MVSLNALKRKKSQLSGQLRTSFVAGLESSNTWVLSLEPWGVFHSGGFTWLDLTWLPSRMVMNVSFESCLVVSREDCCRPYSKGDRDGPLRRPLPHVLRQTAPSASDDATRSHQTHRVLWSGVLWRSRLSADDDSSSDAVDVATKKGAATAATSGLTGRASSDDRSTECEWRRLRARTWCLFPAVAALWRDEWNVEATFCCWWGKRRSQAWVGAGPRWALEAT